MKKNKGFTMIEFIIVFIILAILAAIAIPITLSIISSNQENEAKMMGKTVMSAVQSEFNRLAAEEEHWFSDSVQKGVILNENHKTIQGASFTKDDFKYGFIDISSTAAAQNILKKIDNAEDLLFVYVGAGKFNKYYFDDERYYAYTSFLVVYQYKDKDEPVYYYNGKEVSKESLLSNPAVDKAQGNYDFKIKSGGNTIEIQMYCIKKSDNGKNAYQYWTDYIISRVKKQSN